MNIKIKNINGEWHICEEKENGYISTYVSFQNKDELVTFLYALSKAKTDFIEKEGDNV